MRRVEGVLQLEQRLRAERVAHLRPRDRDLRDALGDVVVDVAVVAAAFPIGNARRGDGDCGT